ncbi:helix-turn-helix domain-containing protein [Vibrio jasicida]|uniref:Helix-turn-helix domain-containing protein n=1 Tax=Vibrio jasicida TaxID=766224 RepID=A0ABW7JEW2_9VIBR
MSLAKRYKEARILAGYSQNEVASILKTTQTSISRIEHGFVANPRKLDEHAKLFGVSESYLKFGFDESNLTHKSSERSSEYLKIRKDLEELDKQGMLKGDVFRAIQSTVSIAIHARQIAV